MVPVGIFAWIFIIVILSLAAAHIAVFGHKYKLCFVLRCRLCLASQNCDGVVPLQEWK
jgi:hypothetical protein